MTKKQFDAEFAALYPNYREMTIGDLESRYNQLKALSGIVTASQYNNWDLPKKYYGHYRIIVQHYKGYEIRASANHHKGARSKSIFVEDKAFNHERGDAGYSKALERAKKYIDKLLSEADQEEDTVKRFHKEDYYTRERNLW